MYEFKDIIDNIEANLEGEIDIDSLARKAGLSNYELRRIFSFLAKIPIGEYIRKRRLSVSANELASGKTNITELAAKYGYDSPSSFSRAFKEFHGVSPSDAAAGGTSLKMLTRLSTDITVGGGFDLAYSIAETPGFAVSGYCAVSDLTDTECCESVWNGYYSSGLPDNLKKDDKIYAVYENSNQYVRCHIGTIGGNGDTVTIPGSIWAIFRLCSTDDAYVNGLYRRINDYWIPSAGFEKRIDIPTVEVFPSDMSDDDFEWEIHIPIWKGN